MIEATSSHSGTRSKIVDVAARLLREDGPAAVTTRKVAEAAGVQAPAIYRLFGDKNGLMDAVAEHVMAVYVSAKAATMEAASAQDDNPLDDLRVGWTTQITFGLANPTLFRLLSDPERVVDSPAARSGRHVLESRIRRVAATGRLGVSEGRAVNMIQAAGIGTIQTLLATSPEDRDAGLADSVYEAVLLRILIAAPAVKERGPMAPAVALRAVAAELLVLSDAERTLLTEWLGRVIDSLDSDRP